MMKLPTVIESRNVIKYNQFDAKSKIDVAVIVFDVFKFSYFMHFNINTLQDLISTTSI
jgi:hypothetical protein